MLKMYCFCILFGCTIFVFGYTFIYKKKIPKNPSYLSAVEYEGPERFYKYYVRKMQRNKTDTVKPTFILHRI